jgi:aryl-alcohol dehydrogenase-like predicted oxidoreductase
MTQHTPTRFQLADGYSFTRIVNGCWQLAAGHSERRRGREQLLSELEELADAGLTTFDCADIYTGVEELLGELRRRLLARDVAIEIHTKFVPDRSELPEMSRRYVEKIIHRSINRLGVERLDLVQYHWWDWGVPGWIDTALHLDELRRQGKIGRLGMTNTDVVHLAEIIDAGVPIATNQVQYSLLDRRPDNGMIAFCREQGIELLCYGTLAGGFLTDRYLGAADPGPALGNRSLIKYRLIIDEFGGWDDFQHLLVLLSRIAAAHGTSVASVASRWVLDREPVAAVILGTSGSHHLRDTLQLDSMELERADRDALASFLWDRPGPPGDVYSVERQWDGPHASIMWTDLNAGRGADD